MSDLAGNAVATMFAVAMVVLLVGILAIAVNLVGALFGAWHASCLLVPHQPSCRGWQ